MKITPSLLYDYLQCAHKPWRDLYGPKEELVSGESPFLKLLWEKGTQHEAKIISGFAHEFLDCSEGSHESRANRTRAAMEERVAYIYQGVIEDEGLFGIPDLLFLDGDEYFPIDIKSGNATDGETADNAPRPKKHYAIQLALYVEILQNLGLCSSRRGYIIDSAGERIEYDLDLPQGKRTPQTFWEYYLEVKAAVSRLIANEEQNEPAMASVCGNCGWQASCKSWCEKQDDLTLLYYVGRSDRDAVKHSLESSAISNLLKHSAEELLERKKSDKTFLKGLGESKLTKMLRRAELLKNNGKPIFYEEFSFPKTELELFFDIEDDPTRDFVYLHGLYIREGEKLSYMAFLAKDTEPESEKKAWGEFWDFIRSLPENDYSVYYYSGHEPAAYSEMRKKYPDVVSEEELGAFFAHENCIDLFSAYIREKTDWPLGSYSLKSIAKYLGFSWRDENPSGAESVAWFNEYIESGDEGIMRRILEYNEDDCRATMAVKDALAQG